MKNSLLFQNEDLPGNISARYQKAKTWQRIFFFATSFALVALIILILSIINRAFGYVAIDNKVDPATLADRPLEELSKEELITILNQNLSKARIRQIERDTPLINQSYEEVYALVIERIVDPKIVATWNLYESLFQQNKIKAEIAEKYPNARLQFRSWLNLRFLTASMSTRPELAGIRIALLGSIYLILITIIVAFPIGIGAAIYLEEYARSDTWFHRLIQTNISNLAGVPSIIYGILGLAIFVRALAPLTSGSIFGMSDSNGRTILSAGLTMALLILPIIIINAQEAIRAVPGSLRQASYGLGATRWQTIWHHVLPSALPGILTGTILAISRAIGETAPLIVVGAVTFITTAPSGPFSRFTALPIQIFNWTTRPQDQFRNLAAAAILVLIATLLTLNSLAIILRNRYSKQ